MTEATLPTETSPSPETPKQPTVEETTEKLKAMLFKEVERKAANNKGGKFNRKFARRAWKKDHEESGTFMYRNRYGSGFKRFTS